MSRLLKLFFISTCLIPVLAWSAAAAPPWQGNLTEPLIRLRFATFDPLQAEPGVPQDLKVTGYSTGQAGPYIVQFRGPVQAAWKDAIVAAGGQLDSYLPDYAFVVRLDQNSRAQVEQLDFVRWVGIYQPAYKLSPQLTANPFNLYRVHVAKWADVDQVRNRLAALSKGVDGADTALVINTSFEQLARIAQLPDVLWIEEFHFFKKYNDIAAGIMNAATPWSNGYTGAGQIVTVADTGLDTGVDNLGASGDIHLDFDNRVTHIRSWPVVGQPGCIGNAGADDGASDKDSGHGTHVTGSAGGNGTRSGGQYKGIAHQATLTLQAIEQLTQWTSICALIYGPQSYALTGIPNNLNTLFQESYDWGARIHTNSWGSDVNGQYDQMAQQADQFVWNHKNFAILFAAGNAGVDANANGFVDEGSVGSPGTAKNVITIGASENVRSSGGYNPGGPCSTYANCFGYPAPPTSSDPLSDSSQELAAFSSRGPTDDGRIKPDVVAPGTNILSTRSSLATGNLWGAGPTQYYVYSGGTSMATPLAAGAATVIRDYLADGVGNANPSAALIKAILINSAVDITGYGNSSQEAGKPIPNNHEGWGRINLATATSSTNRTFVDNLSLFTNIIHTYNFTVTNSAIPLKTSLVWTDYQGNPAASVQLVNNLDLRVTAPNGTPIYNGNNFNNGWSSSGGSPDQVNNVENVYIQSPATGPWTIEVRGVNVPQGPQPYALVVYGQGNLSGPTGISSGSTIYLPLIMKSSGGSNNTGPTSGFWESTTGDEFYVTTDQANADNFAVYVSVNGCGNYKITHPTPEPITNNHFSFSGSFYASGTFNSATTASGTDGLNNYLISGCGYVNGGPWSWNAGWKNGSQPTFQTVQVVGPEMIEPAATTNTGKTITTVTPIK